MRSKQAEYSARHREKNLEKVRKNTRKSVAKCRRKAKSEGRKYQDPRLGSRHRHHGLTEEQYNAQFVKQEGRCDLCGEPPIVGERLVSDHNHGTGENRGLIHRSCNAGIGMFKDNPKFLRKAAIYLEKY